MSEFSYLSDKILNAEFDYSPFKHVLIEDYLSEKHLNIVLSEEQIHFDEVYTTEELIDNLFAYGYVIQNFPGCSTDVKEYLRHYKSDSFPSQRKGNPVESFGMTFRLNRYDNPFIQEITEYFNSSEFKNAMVEKFEIGFETRIITAVQKNLSHYEISPHPDVREKGLTYLLNINKDDSISDYPIHTHLLEFKDEWKFIKDYWKTNLSKNRCWVPWDWCNTVKNTTKNNSIVLFSPNVDTLHAVKLYYDHKKFQRTQFYGNLMGVGSIVPQMNYKELIEIKNARKV